VNSKGVVSEMINEAGQIPEEAVNNAKAHEQYDVLKKSLNAVHRPTTVRVGCYTYAIEWVDGTWTAGTNRYGECDYLTQIIRVNGQLSNTRIAETFLHELMHAVSDWYGRADAETIDREDLCLMVGHCLPMIWIDNPEVFAWWCELIGADMETVN